MAPEFGGETQRTYLERLGMAQRLSLEIPETSTPQMPRQWKAAEIATVSYGHGIAVSLPHLAAAVSAASGDGVFLEPTLLHRAPADRTGDRQPERRAGRHCRPVRIGADGATGGRGQ